MADEQEKQQHLEQLLALSLLDDAVILMKRANPDLPLENFEVIRQLERLGLAVNAYAATAHSGPVYYLTDEGNAFVESYDSSHAG